MLRDKWRIAWCHNGVTGGAKRATHAMVRELSRRGHHIDEFVVCDNVQGDYLPLAEFVDHSYERKCGTLKRTRLRPYILNTYWQLTQYLTRRCRAERMLRDAAGEINGGKYDIVHIDHHPKCYATGLLPYLKGPAVVYSHEVSAVRYRRVNEVDVTVNGETRRIGHAVKRCYTWWCELPLKWRERIEEDDEITRIRGRPLTLTNSYFSKETFFHAYRYVPSLCRYGVDVEVFRPLSIGIEQMILSVGRLTVAKQHHLA